MSDYAKPQELINTTRARAFAPRKHLTVSEWSDKNRRLSKKSSPEAGPWRTDRNPPLREIMDCLSARSTIHHVVFRAPIQIGKTEIGVNALGYWMTEAPGPIMVCLPGEVSQMKWINQKLNPMIEETGAVQEALVSLNSRNAANTKDFKDFIGGQLYIEHAGSPARLKSTTVKYLIVDELSEFAANLNTGDDPLMMLEDRYSAYSATYKRLDISSPGTRGICRIDELYEKSDQRRFHMPCPHCNEEIVFEWAGLHWSPDGSEVWYVCPECAAIIHEHHKTEMIAKGRWIPANPESKIRGYTINCLYYQIGLGPRWSTLVEMWQQAHNDPAKLKTFVNSRLAEAWEDPSMRAAKLETLVERTEDYPLKIAPLGVAVITAGVDTQDDRLEVQIVGWGKELKLWVIDYMVLYGDPSGDEVWRQLTDILMEPIEHVNGHKIRISATYIDQSGHKTEDVKEYASRNKALRVRSIFGSTRINAPVVGKPKTEDFNYRGVARKNGVKIQEVGVNRIKNRILGRIAYDADKSVDERFCHFSSELEDSYFRGMLSETKDGRSGRWMKKRNGIRNEVLDTMVYAYAALFHEGYNAGGYTSSRWDAELAKYSKQLSPLEIASHPKSDAAVSSGQINLSRWRRK